MIPSHHFSLREQSIPILKICYFKDSATNRNNMNAVVPKVGSSLKCDATPHLPVIKNCELNHSQFSIKDHHKFLRVSQPQCMCVRVCLTNRSGKPQNRSPYTSRPNNTQPRKNSTFLPPSARANLFLTENEHSSTALV